MRYSIANDNLDRIASVSDPYAGSVGGEGPRGLPLPRLADQDVHVTLTL